LIPLRLKPNCPSDDSPTKSVESCDAPELCENSNIIIHANNSQANGVLVIWRGKLLVLTVAHTLVIENSDDESSNGGESPEIGSNISMKSPTTISLFYLDHELEWKSVYHMVTLDVGTAFLIYREKRQFDACVFELSDKASDFLASSSMSPVDLDATFLNWCKYCDFDSGHNSGKNVYGCSKFAVTDKQTGDVSFTVEHYKSSIRIVQPPLSYFTGDVTKGTSGSAFFSTRTHNKVRTDLLMGITSSCKFIHDCQSTTLIMVPFYLNLLIAIFPTFLWSDGFDGQQISILSKYINPLWVVSKVSVSQKEDLAFPLTQLSTDPTNTDKGGNMCADSDKQSSESPAKRPKGEGNNQ
jgi:hypothetical protein